MNSSSPIQRLWQKDASLWSQDPRVQKDIAQRLGWLDVKDTFSSVLPDLQQWADAIEFSHVILLGMGGSSLAAEVFAQMLPHQEKKRTLHVLDTTDTYALKQLHTKVDFSQALFVVASKSGTTLEVHSLLAYLWHHFPQGDHYVAITDAGSPLEQLAKQRGFLRTFINPSDIGGRFSSLSYFGLVPLALLGGNTQKMFERLDVSHFQQEANDALNLASQLHRSMENGKDKLVLSGLDDACAMEVWIEQLVAESTGKHQMGMLPVVGDTLDDQHGDRHIHVFTKPSEASLILNRDSVSTLHDFYDVGREMFRWEIATSLLAHWLNIDPFDQPHVELAKKQTRTMLDMNAPQDAIAQALSDKASDPKTLHAFLSQAQSPSYIALLSYLPENQTTLQTLKDFQKQWSQTYQVTVTVGRGPRYLHSTGQYHKGGPNHGFFVILTEHQPSLPVPGQSYDFNTLKLSQALGDIEALLQQGQKVFLLHQT